jgi:HD-GYP domain-containing protein (c-di-GMP phosphodiesterase class II)
MKIDFGQMVNALSNTLDLVGIDEVQHGKRVGFMLWEFARVMGLDKDSQRELYHVGLLHDCGVSSTHVHKNLVDQIDWKDSNLHCEIGAERLKHFPPLSFMSEIILYHHTHWEDLIKLNLTERINRSSNLIFLADRVDALAAHHLNVNLLEVKDEIRLKIRELSNSFFNPEFVDVFMAVSEAEAFWITLQPRYLMGFIQSRENENGSVAMPLEDVIKMAELFAQIVDAKSPFTAEHSEGVSRLAKYLSTIEGLSKELCDKIKISGLLHDIGKLRVPDEVLDKPAKLDHKELAHMRHHSFETYEILSRISGLEEIALWAANHHEKISGDGYPFHRKAEDLSVESRIVAVADVFQALGQNRPYRGPLSPDKIMDILKEFAKREHLDADLVALADKNLDQCYHEAMLAA